MRNYLSFGGGVNSVAMYLLLKDQGIEFKAIFVDHGTDWPSTYMYVKSFAKKYPITIIKPNVEGYDNLYNYCWDKNLIPSMQFKWCSDKFKIITARKYMESPAFVFIGYDANEKHRAKINSEKGFEQRYPLIENNLGRRECIELIEIYGLPIPPKSGCYICPWQGFGEWKKLRREHPPLFCKADHLERKCNLRRKLNGKEPIFINGKCSVKSAVEENQIQIFKQDEYPPCECML